MSTVRFLPLASGSKGNCTYMATPHAQVLIDAGLSARRTFSLLREQGINPIELDAVFITHTHGDHIYGLPQLMKQLHLRVYCHKRCVPELLEFAAIAEPRIEQFAPFNGTDGFEHRDLDILPSRVSHDSDPTVGFKFFAGRHRIGFLTDLGVTDPGLSQTFGDCDLLVLESNHCPEMLANGRYPEVLKRRIRGKQGHLSNRQAVEFVTGFDKLPPRLLLGHLSENNNAPEAVTGAFTRIETGAIPHEILQQQVPGPLVEFA